MIIVILVVRYCFGVIKYRLCINIFMENMMGVDIVIKSLRFVSWLLE